jgi:hypothetical protein
MFGGIQLLVPLAQRHRGHAIIGDVLDRTNEFDCVTGIIAVGFPVSLNPPVVTVLMMQTVNNRIGNSIVHMRLDRRHDGVVGIGHIHPAKLRLVLVERRKADAVSAAHVGGRNAALLILDHTIELLFVEP